MICNPLLEMKNSHAVLRKMFERNKDLAQKNPEQSQALSLPHIAKDAKRDLICRTAEFTDWGKATPGVVERSGMEIRDTTDQAGLNKTEREYWEHLKQRLALDHQITWIGVQCITLKLAFDTRYTADFWTFEGGQIVAREVKGFWRDDAKVKIKVAARLFPWIKFVVVKKLQYSWSEEEVKP